MQQVGVKYYKYKKIYLVVIGSIIQADGVLFEGRAEAKGTANDLNVTQNIIECKCPLLRYLEAYETLIVTNCKRAVAIQIHLQCVLCKTCSSTSKFLEFPLTSFKLLTNRKCR
jgi:hypothetical protein